MPPRPRTMHGIRSFPRCTGQVKRLPSGEGRDTTEIWAELAASQARIGSGADHSPTLRYSFSLVPLLPWLPNAFEFTIQTGLKNDNVELPASHDALGRLQLARNSLPFLHNQL